MARFQKGWRGGPGRPRKDSTLKTVLEWTINEAKFTDEKTQKQYTGREAIVRKLLDLALGGDLNAIKAILDRVDGPVKQSMTLDGNMGLYDVLDKIEKDKSKN